MENKDKYLRKYSHPMVIVRFGVKIDDKRLVPENNDFQWK
jgi:hypothetical protein